MTLRYRLAALLVFLCASSCVAQNVPPYSPRQSFSAFAEYSNTSSRIILGASQNRRFAALGFGYSLRLLHTRHFEWRYAPEVIPLAFIQDPIAEDTFGFSDFGTFHQSAPTVSPCRPRSFAFPDPSDGPPEFTFNRTCDTRWTYVGGLSPLGQRISFRPQKRIQPFVIGNAGFLVAPHDVPVNDSSRFNFTFEFGGGVEFFRDRRHSWSIDYRIHHLSNDYTGTNNPGVDNQIYRISYALGR